MGKETTEYVTRLDDLMPLIQDRLAAGQKVRFSPMGVSMLPMLRQGVDSVELSAAPPKLKKYDIPLYRRENGQYVLHRIVDAGSTYTCIGDNQFVPEFGVEHIQVLAMVTAFYRGERRWTVSAPAYRFYCVFWHYSRPLRHFWRRGLAWLRRQLR